MVSSTSYYFSELFAAVRDKMRNICWQDSMVTKISSNIWTAERTNVEHGIEHRKYRTALTLAKKH